MITTLWLACAFNACAVAMFIAWYMNLAPWGFKGAIASAMLGWWLLPPMGEAREILEAMKAHTKDS